MSYKKFFRLRKCLVHTPSGLVLSVSVNCYGTKGIASHLIHNRVSIGKAGRTVLLGRKPIVRGVAMNPVDHPHGGGEGKKSKSCFPRTA
jgi:large subunit ribosomal protein L2